MKQDSDNQLEADYHFALGKADQELEWAIGLFHRDDNITERIAMAIKIMLCEDQDDIVLVARFARLGVARAGEICMSRVLEDEKGKT